MRLLAACLIIHALLAQVAPSPWWVPDFTLIGLVLTISKTPHRWPVCTAAAALWVQIWTVRFAVPIGIGYVAVGFGVQQLARYWDLQDERLRALLVITSSALLLGEALWLDQQPWTCQLFSLMSLRIAVTAASLLLVRVIWGARVRLPRVARSSASERDR